ncbi:MAG: hypothetical protein EBZ49_00305 [Proteobacteria bacterium]|nr:hypothetical protein [Pseudomonadota bacterium]
MQYINILSLLLAHATGWFCLSGLVTIVRGHSGTMKFSSALGMAVFSTIFQLMLVKLGYLNL